MRILFINSFHHLGGGDRTYMFNLAKVLEKEGHTVAYFAMHHPKNISSKYNEYFLNEIDFKKAFSSKKPKDIFTVLARSIYSFDAKKKLNKVISVFNPDIAHLHTIHKHISPSVIHTLKKTKVPILWTLHNFNLLCPHSTFFTGKQICEKCKPHKYYQATKNKCIKDSYAASMVASISSYTHHFLKIYKLVDVFLCPSQFLLDKYIEYNFETEKLILLRNFMDIRDVVPNHQVGDYGLYAGRLGYEKGIFTLIKALKINNKIKFKIVGDGPLKKELIEYCAINNINNVEFLGFKSGDDLWHLYENAMFTVLPSECYENGPMTIIESFALGKPVIGSRIGGIPEMIEGGKNGFLFEPGNYNDLSDKINLMLESSYRELSENARETAEKYYSKEQHYEKIMEIYKSLVL